MAFCNRLLGALSAEIVLANAGSNPSGGWVAPAVYPIANSAGGPYGTTVPAVNGDAKWMWYDSGGDTSSGHPFLSGFDHDEYLIFRIPVTAVPEPSSILLGLFGACGLALAADRRRWPLRETR